MHENPKIDLDMQYKKNDFISNNSNQNLYRKISLPEDYSPFEIQLISKISELFPVSFDWLVQVPFKRNCTVQELSSIEQGLNSDDLQQRTKALFRFIDFRPFMEQEIQTIELGIRQRMQSYFDLSFDDEFKKSLDEMIHQVAYEEYLKRTKPKIEQYIGAINNSEENQKISM